MYRRRRELRNLIDTHPTSGTMHRVNAEQALQKQIEMYRAMTGEQRLQIALNLHELSCQVARDGIQQQFPNATPQEVEEKLRARIALAREYDRA